MGSMALARRAGYWGRANNTPKKERDLKGIIGDPGAQKSKTHCTEKGSPENPKLTWSTLAEDRQRKSKESDETKHDAWRTLSWETQRGIKIQGIGCPLEVSPNLQMAYARKSKMQNPAGSQSF
jgi:hypothetical protein